MAKSNTTSFVVIIVLLIIDIAVSLSNRFGQPCGSSSNVNTPEKYSTNSHATLYEKEPVVKLPESGEDYKLLGQIPGLKNFAVQYDDNFYRGGEVLSIEGMENLKKWGIKTIFSVTPTDLERLLAEKFNIKLVELNFEKKSGIPVNVLERYHS